MDPVVAAEALSLLNTGLQALSEYSAKVKAGTITSADNDAMAAQLGVDIATLRADAAAAAAAGNA